MLYLILGGLGWLIGSVGYWDLGWFFGLSIGLLSAETIRLRKRIKRLETNRTDGMQKPVEPDARSGKKPSFPVPEAPKSRTKPVAAQTAVPSGGEEDLTFDLPSFETTSAQREEEATSPGGGSDTFDNRLTRIPSRLGAYLKRFFTTGNVFTKIGVIVLFFGFAFLLKYAAQRNLVPIEFRLMGVFVGGLGLLGAGWRLRGKRLTYGLLLQGCGVGVLYLTVYAAARFYHLLPYGFSFAIMLCLVILSGVLASLQNAKYLAITGVVGGFLAPVLMSTGSGSHVALFSYYSLLNLGIVGIAWRRPWRELNLVGFIFTFVIASIWGGRYYQPRYFASTEPFLILFFIYYVSISVLYAIRQPIDLKGYVDGTLVFGLPIVAFGLQYGLVRDFEYGLALSALILGMFYILLATLLWKRRIDGFRMLIESFLAFGVVFGSLAIPLALDGRWTSAAWALEGGAILWIGIRQDRLLPRIFGILLQAGAGTFFIKAVNLTSRQIPLANSFFIGCLLISLSGIFSSWYLTRRSDQLRPWERHAVVPLMVWGLAWWFGAAFHEIERFIGWRDRASAALLHVAASSMLMEIVSRRLAWRSFAYPALLLLPGMGFACLSYLGDAGDRHFFARFGFVAWVVAFSIQYILLFRCENRWPEKLLPRWHQFTFWLLIYVITFEGGYYVDLLLQTGRTWQYCIWGLIPGTIVLLMLGWGERLSWPVCRFREAYFGAGIALPAIYLLLWAVLVNFHHGDPSPLPFVPLINPLEITQVYLLFVILKGIGHQGVWLKSLDIDLNDTVIKAIAWGAGFLLLNAVVARTIHFWGHVPYTFWGLYRSLLFQSSISILWGVTALVTTIWATRKGSRPIWIAGATILSLVVIKLFVVDLAGTGTVARIVSFLGVGSLMLLIGYFSPIPPARNKEVP